MQPVSDMTTPPLSRLTSKGQTIIPTKIRKALRLAADDRLAFDLENGKVTLRWADVLDLAFLKLTETTFEEWNSPQDKTSFRDYSR